jgi:phage FluMu protein Com
MVSDTSGQAISVRCVGCGAVLQIPATLDARHEVQCPHCQQVFAVGQAARVEMTPAILTRSNETSDPTASESADPASIGLRRNVPGHSSDRLASAPTGRLGANRPGARRMGSARPESRGRQTDETEATPDGWPSPAVSEQGTRPSTPANAVSTTAGKTGPDVEINQGGISASAPAASQSSNLNDEKASPLEATDGRDPHHDPSVTDHSSDTTSDPDNLDQSTEEQRDHQGRRHHSSRRGSRSRSEHRSSRSSRHTSWNDIGVDGLPIATEDSSDSTELDSGTGGTRIRDVIGLFTGLACSVLLTQVSLWWLVGIDPLGLGPTIADWAPSIVPTELHQ